MPRLMAGVAFFTGFPGFIGKRLVARLLRDDPELRVAALVESSMADRARSAAAEIEGGDRIEVLEGDIGERGLGLSAADRDPPEAATTPAVPPPPVHNPPGPPPNPPRREGDRTRHQPQVFHAGKQPSRPQ